MTATWEANRKQAKSLCHVEGKTHVPSLLCLLPSLPLPILWAPAWLLDCSFSLHRSSNWSICSSYVSAHRHGPMIITCQWALPLAPGSHYPWLINFISVVTDACSFTLLRVFAAALPTLGSLSMCVEEQGGPRTEPYHWILLQWK